MRTILTHYAACEQAIRQIRREVFIVEQKVPLELEFDGRDADCIHAVTFHQDLPIATGRLDIAKDGKVGRVAVLKEYRRQGVGRAIMEALESGAREKGLERIWFHAQTHAVPFYKVLGYRVVGEEFVEADIPHVAMEKAL